MDIFQILVLALYLPQVFTKSKSKSRKYKASSSDEDSIENLLYYKDCQRQGKPETTTTEHVQLRYDPPPPPPPPRQPECPFPKMCCALTCGNECGGNQPSYGSRQMEPMNGYQPMQPMPSMPQPHQPGMGAVQPQIIRRKKKMKFPPGKLPGSLPTRRDMSGFTKEKIKSLIAQDHDIRKILKDLVRVTMQKVDLLDMINSTPENVPKTEDDGNVVSSPAPVVAMDEYDE
ncbi:uncharacterized protein LOC126053878 [Helicoverpa armigera]|uniref:uncharacterized protein LOC126053878 n=1 Tax=Helicoverpa armigera TaxID=29058 RepID=UPI00308370F4